MADILHVKYSGYNHHPRAESFAEFNVKTIESPNNVHDLNLNDYKIILFTTHGGFNPELLGNVMVDYIANGGKLGKKKQKLKNLGVLSSSQQFAPGFLFF